LEIATVWSEIDSDKLEKGSAGSENEKVLSGIDTDWKENGSV
jgi:hypothetical protein